MPNPIVSIVMVEACQNDGSFEKSIDSVWIKRDLAVTELDRIANKYNCNKGKHINWRAVKPSSQINKLSVELLIDGFYKCKNFYSIVEKELQS